MSVWKTLSAIDCSKHVEKKGNLSYLSWAWAWQTLMEHYPDSTYTFSDPMTLCGDTVEVSVSVTVKGATHTMWLPVMDNRNKAIVLPTARDISDARMRCLVKAIAMHGLGIYLYAGEDLPAAVQDAVVSKQRRSNLCWRLPIQMWRSSVRYSSALLLTKCGRCSLIRHCQH